MLHEFSVWERVLDFQEVEQWKSTDEKAINWRQKISVKHIESQLDNFTESCRSQKKTNETSLQADWVLEQDNHLDFCCRAATAPELRTDQLNTNGVKRKFTTCWYLRCRESADKQLRRTSETQQIFKDTVSQL